MGTTLKKIFKNKLVLAYDLVVMICPSINGTTQLDRLAHQFAKKPRAVLERYWKMYASSRIRK